MKPRYIVTQFDDKTFRLSDTRTGRVYAECADSEAGSDAQKRAKRLARLLNSEKSLKERKAILMNGLAPLKGRK